LFVPLRLTHPSPGIEPSGQMKCAVRVQCQQP